MAPTASFPWLPAPKFVVTFPPGLHRDLGDPREVVERHHVADHEDLGTARQRAVRLDVHAAGAVQRGGSDATA